MAKTYLVTGGGGFIGSHVCERLLKEGQKVVCVDNFITGTRENFEDFGSNPNFTVIEHDVVEPFPESITGQKYDAIFHLACAASPDHYQARRAHTTLTCVLGTHHAILLAKQNDCPLLVSSTSEVYGDPEVHPQPEDYKGCVNPIGPRACYDEGKRCGETLLFDAHRVDKVKIRVVRIFNTYGPRMCFNDGRIISNFVVQALQNGPISIYGDGKQTRSFQFVTDLLDGFWKFIEHPTEIGPVNIGNPDEHSVGEMAEIIKEMCKSTSEIKYTPATEDDPKQRKPDITKAGRVLDWRPQVGLKEGLEKTIEEFRARLVKQGKISA